MGKVKLNIPMCAALVLLLLTMISIHLTSGLYARYTTTATGSDSARVARFDVQGSFGLKDDMDKTDVVVDCNQAEESGTYIITVTNNSEVVVDYVIYVTLDKKVNATDLNVYWADGDSPLQFQNGVAQKMQFTNKRPLAPGEVGTHAIKFGVYTWTTVTVAAPRTNTAEWTLGFTVDIDVKQVD